MKKKIGRNEPCPCGSGKKFKKCCESKMISKRYLAHKLENVDTTSNKVSSLTSLIPPSIPTVPSNEPVKTDLAEKTPEESKTKKVVKKTTKTVKKTTKKKSTSKKS